MDTDYRMVALSAALALVAALLGWTAPGILLADFGPPVAVLIILAGLPLILIPFAIGWLTPSLWWLAAAGSIGLLNLAILALTSAPPQSPGEMLLRFPLLPPLLLALAFGFLGRTIRKRSLRR